MSSLRNGGVSIVFHVAHEHATDALKLHMKQGVAVRLEVFEDGD